MTHDNENSERDWLINKLEKDLLGLYGPMLNSKALQTVLGYKSPEAFRQAISRKTVPVKIFAIENRRGKFALAIDVATWIAEQKLKA